MLLKQKSTRTSAPTCILSSAAEERREKRRGPSRASARPITCGASGTYCRDLRGVSVENTVEGELPTYLHKGEPVPPASRSGYPGTVDRRRRTAMELNATSASRSRPWNGSGPWSGRRSRPSDASRMMRPRNSSRTPPKPSPTRRRPRPTAARWIREGRGRGAGGAMTDLEPHRHDGDAGQGSLPATRPSRARRWPVPL